MSTTDMTATDPVEIIATEEELRAHIGPAFQPSVDKVIDHLDLICRQFIERSPFVVLASCDGAGRPELSPKGDPMGFVKIINDRLLAIPDRPGNRRIDTILNLVTNPNVALLFLVPGMGETLRVYGTAQIVRDLSIREPLAVNGKVPALATVVHVERAMYHCPKCVIRSRIWDQASWTDTKDLTSIGPAMRLHTQTKKSVQALEKDAEKAGVLELY